MNKIYIAGGITGVNDYRKIFKIAETRLKRKGYICMNPSVLPEGFEQDDYMDICTEMLLVCDTIYMLKGWKTSLGAVMELNCAVRNNIEVIYEYN